MKWNNGQISYWNRWLYQRHHFVRDPKVHLEVLENFLTHAKDNHFTVLGITYSPIRGPEGNIEYLGYLRKSGEPDTIPDLAALVDASHSELKERRDSE